MAYVNGNKPIVTNGLIYALDFGNTKSYTSGANTARSLVYDTAVTTVTGSSGLPTLVNGVLNITSSQFIRRTGSLDSIDPNGAFTISLVAKPNTVGSLLTQNLTGKVFQIQSTPSSSNIGFNLGTGTYSRTIPGFNSSSLQHISFRYNSGSIDTFLNGIPVTSSIANASLLPTGQLNALFFGSGSNSFSGSLANLYVYNRALSPDEIYENYLVMAGRYGLPVIPKPYSIDENLYQWIQATNTTDTNIISAISTFILGLKSTGLWNKIQVIYPFVGTTTGSQTINLKEPGLYRLGLTGSFSASSAGLFPSSSTAFVDSIPGNTVHPLVNSASAHLSLLSYDTPAGNGFLGGNSAPAVGGDLIIQSGSKIYHAFKTVGTSSFFPLVSSITNVEVMVIAGGGGGGNSRGGGGGAGGLIYSSSFAITPNTPVQVIVGNGGTQGTNGQSSSFGTIQSTGGGFGGDNIISANGGNGGSGGGGFYTGNSGSGIPGQGNDGSTRGLINSGTGGGGGGAGSASILNPEGIIGNSGGSGLFYPQFSLLGGSPAGWFAGGGGGATAYGIQYTGSGGIGGGGNGASSGTTPFSGVDNTGGGGGGGYNIGVGGSGGSGIVIVGYTTPPGLTAITGSGTGLYLTDSAITGSVNSQFTAGITGSGTIGFLTVSRTGSGVFSIHKNNVSQSIASASLGALSTDIFFNTANLAGSGSLPLQANLAYASIGAGLTTSEVATYYNLVSQLQTSLKRQNTLLDTYSGAAAAYSLRRIGPSGYFGPAIRVRRDSDNALRDIGFTSDGQLDTVGLLDFVGVTGSGFVQTWYDQSSNNRNAIQDTAGNQPQIVNTGSLLISNKYPAVNFNGTSMFLTSSNTNFLLAERSTFTVFQMNTQKLDGRIWTIWNGSGNDFDKTSGYIFQQGNNSRNDEFGMFGSTGASYFLSVGSINTVTPQSVVSEVLSGTTGSLYKNSTLAAQDTSFTAFDSAPTNNFYIGTGFAGFYADTRVQEIVIHTASVSTTRTGIESNINSNYKIYGSATASFDPDYQAFITATGITEPTQSAALETLVSDLKSYGLWSKMKAIYPMVTDKNNRFAQSEDFSQTWNAVSSSVTVNQITAPNGTSTADLIREEAGTGDHYVYQTVDTLVSGNEYVLSVYGRFLNRPWIALQTNDGAQAWFNLQTGVTGSFTGSSVSITNVGSGWYRCALFYTASSNGAKNQHIHLADANGNYNYAGVATTGSYLWGAQFENGNLLGPYKATTSTGFTTGSMLDQMKFNLRNPADTDAAFRLTYSGSWNGGYSGVKPDGTTAYGNAFIKNNAMGSSSIHLSAYSRTNPAGSDGVVIGNSTSYYNLLRLKDSSNNFRGGINANTLNTVSNSNSTGYYIGLRTSTTTNKFFKNNTLLGTLTDNVLVDSNDPIYLGAAHRTGNPIFYDNKEIAIATIGDGLTDYEAKALYWIVQKFQTTLGRQVY
jgi:hypothetical protein